MQVFGPNELSQDVLQRGLCIGCGACVNLCPYLKSYKGKTAMLFPCDNGQGRCHAHCPKAEVDLDTLAQSFWQAPYSAEPAGPCREMLVARAGQSAPRGRFQDGGTVSALVAFALATGRIDAAVLTGSEGLLPVPGLATRAEEVASFARSKYTAAPTLAALNLALKEGGRRLGVVGTPCQLTALAKMRAHAGDGEDPAALTIGLFCTWALDTRALAALIERRAPGRTVRKITIPPPPASQLVVETDQEPVEIPLDDIRPLVPAGCGICPDMTAEWSDLSAGAMEGKSGWNTVIVRTPPGEALVREAAAKGYLEIEALPAESRRHLETAAAGKKRRALARLDADGLLNSTGPDRRAALRVNRDTIARILKEEP